MLLDIPNRDAHAERTSPKWLSLESVEGFARVLATMAVVAAFGWSAVYLEALQRGVVDPAEASVVD